MPETYTPFTWANGSAGGTPITAARLNSIEQGIEAIDDRVAEIEAAKTDVRTVAYSATPTVDPTVAGDRINITATGNITALSISTTGASDRQVLQFAVLASGGDQTVTFASAIRTSTGIARGPYSVPTGELLRASAEYSSLTSAWSLLGATVTAA